MHICSKHRFYKSKTLAALALLTAFISAPKAFAQAETNATEAITSQYYTIDENNLANLAPEVQDAAENQQVANPADLSPFNTLSLREFVAYARTIAVNLLRWTYHDQAVKQAPEKYDRKQHFGRWINDPNDPTCYNTRARVLIRDSVSQVSFKEANHCVVEKGHWEDPYAGTTVRESQQIQIDHMVPLKNAYISGAWEWNFQTRCEYANYMGNKFHLISASGHENMSKGDKSPADYLPPNQTYRCEYLENWLKIKLIWKLKMDRAEVEAIRQAVKDNGCRPSRFALSAAELKRQRKLIYEHKNDCPDR